MATFYARCSACRGVFPVRNLISGNAGRVSLAGNKINPCPLCGTGPGLVLDGEYSLVNDVATLMSGPLATWEALQELARVVNDSVKAGEAPEKTLERAEAFLPSLANFRNKWAKYAVHGVFWLASQLTAIKLAQELTPTPVTQEQVSSLIAESERRIIEAIENAKPSAPQQIPPSNPGRMSERLDLKPMRIDFPVAMRKLAEYQKNHRRHD